MSVFNREFASWKLFPREYWKWKNFSPQEIACRGDGKLMVDEHAMDLLQKLRERLGRPMILNSAYRSEWWNRKVGGAKYSYHKKAQAFDVRMDNQNPQEFERIAKEVGFKGIIRYPKNGFIHIDTRSTPYNSGGQFPKSSISYTPEFPPEPKRVPETPKEDPILKAVGVAAASGVIGQVGSTVSGLHPVAQGIATGALVLAGLALAYVIYKRLKD